MHTIHTELVPWLPLLPPLRSVPFNTSRGVHSKETWWKKMEGREAFSCLSFFFPVLMFRFLTSKESWIVTEVISFCFCRLCCHPRSARYILINQPAIYFVCSLFVCFPDIPQHVILSQLCTCVLFLCGQLYYAAKLRDLDEAVTLLLLLFLRCIYV